MCSIIAGGMSSENASASFRTATLPALNHSTRIAIHNSTGESAVVSRQ